MIMQGLDYINLLTYVSMIANIVGIMLSVIIIRNSYKSRNIVFWILIMLHLVFDLLATFSWNALLNEHGISSLIPVPSVPDYLWFISFLFFGISMMYYWISIKKSLEKSFPLKSFAIILSVTIIVFTLSITIYSSYDLFYQDLTGPFYAAFTAFAAISCIPMIYLFKKGELSRPWVYLCIAGFLYIFGEIFWNYETMTDTTNYFSQSTWLLRYLFIIYSIYQLSYKTMLPLARDLTFENINDAMFIISNDNLLLDLNKKAYNFLNLKKGRKRLIGNEIKKVFSNTKELNEYDFSSDLEFRHGNKNYYSVKSTLIINQSEVLGKIISITDVTQSKIAQNLKLKMQKEKEINELRNQFLMRISHELRNPLTPIIGYSEELSSKYKNEPYLKKISQNAFLLKNLLNKVLSVFSIETGTKMVLANVNLKDVVQKCINEYKDSFPLGGVQIKTEMNDSYLMIDESKFREAVFNIIENAVKNTKKGVLKIILKDKGKYAELKFTDNGSGIPPDILEKLNSNTYMPKKESSVFQKGLGLGILLVKLVVKSHKGKLSITSRPKKGTEIKILLPKK